VAIFRHWRRCTVAAAAALAATAGASSIVWSQQQSAPFLRIVTGEGHFNASGKPFHYWDKEKEIPAVCARCHAAEGVPEYLRTGRNNPAPHAPNAYACTNCHADMATRARHTVAKVTFPSGVGVDSGSNDSNLCMTCHQGRESTASVNKAIAGIAPDAPEPKLNFVHVHYFPAGATLYGTEAKVAYEYAGKTYGGRFNHVPTVANCSNCHEAHSGQLAVQKCATCHQGVTDKASLANIRMTTRGDFDGDGKEEGLPREIAGLHRQLYAAIQRYAKEVGGASIAFSKDAHPYWYNDPNGNGQVDPDELKPANKYPAYTPRLLQAVYNHSYVTREPGAAFHNARYTLQILYDSLESLAQSGKAGVTMQGKMRP
jgi:hypothetical protein